MDAIDAAERLIYIETQYFSSRRIYEALVRRLRATDRPALEIVVVVNERAEALKEELAVGLRQAKNLERLRTCARRAPRITSASTTPSATGANDTFRATYIHSKVMVVDDRFLTVGSANLTNRSMGVDSELHASWEASAASPDDRASDARDPARPREPARGARGGRRRAGDPGLSPHRRPRRAPRRLSRRPGARLQTHGPPTPVQAAAMEVVDPQDLPFDPELPDVDPAAHDEPADEARGRRPSRVRSGLAAAGRRVGVKLSRREP